MNDGRTHWDERWTLRGHHDCAVAFIRHMMDEVDRRALEVERLREENAGVRWRAEDWHRVADIRAAEIQRLHPDAERYRWLRDYMKNEQCMPGQTPSGDLDEYVLFLMASDSARAKEGK